MHKPIIAALISLLLLGGCEPSVPAGKIRVKNDSQDREYNIVKISGGGVYQSLKPGEFTLLPKGTTSISFSRAYKDYTLNYRVQCPNPLQSSSGITIKLIDVHLNRISGGCKTVSASRS